MNPEPQLQPPVGQELFHIAFAERKKMNLELLKQHITARSISVRQRTRIYTCLQSMFKDKVEYTKQFIKDLMRYFEDTLTLYSYFYKSIGKLDLNKKNKDIFVYEAFQKAALELTELNNGEVQNLKVLTNWIEKILTPALQALLDLYREWTKNAKKQLESHQSDFESSNHKDMKFYEKIGQNNDLLENQVIFADKMGHTDESLVKWGRKIYSAWIELLKKQGEIRQEIQKNIVEFHDKFTKVYNESESSRSLLKFWTELQGVSTWYRTFASVLNEKDVQFISYGLPNNDLRENFQPFIDMKFENDRIGDPLKLIEILQNKRFKCKLQKSQREYLDVIIYFTVENNILMFDEAKKKVVLKLREQGFKIQRLSENLVEMAGVEEGIIFNSNKKENIHFSTMDEAEEFSFFVENLLQQNKQQKQ